MTPWCSRRASPHHLSCDSFSCDASRQMVDEGALGISGGQPAPGAPHDSAELDLAAAAAAAPPRPLAAAPRAALAAVVAAPPDVRAPPAAVAAASPIQLLVLGFDAVGGFETDAHAAIGYDRPSRRRQPQGGATQAPIDRFDSRGFSACEQRARPRAGGTIADARGRRPRNACIRWP